MLAPADSSRQPCRGNTSVRQANTWLARADSRVAVLGKQPAKPSTSVGQAASCVASQDLPGWCSRQHTAVFVKQPAASVEQTAASVEHPAASVEHPASSQLAASCLTKAPSCHTAPTQLPISWLTAPHQTTNSSRQPTQLAQPGPANGCPANSSRQQKGSKGPDQPKSEMA